jgi:UPF0716 protein FxsA
MLLLIPLLAIAELVVIFQVAHAIGWLETFALLILVSIVGGALVRRVGLGVLRRAQQQLEAHQAPHKEMVDGLLVLLAGVLLFIPGFITAAVGLLLLLPPVRAGIRVLAARRLQRRVGTGFTFVRWGNGVFGGGAVIDAEGYEAHSPGGPPGSAGGPARGAIDTRSVPGDDGER